MFFFLYGFPVPLVSAFIDAGRMVAPEGYGSIEAAQARLEEVLGQTFPKGFDKETMETGLSLDQESRLLAVIHTAVVSGVFNYPPGRH